MGEGSNFSLVNIDGKPLEKLIEVIGQGIGTLYRPTAIRKEAKAKAFEIEVLAKAKAISNAEGKLLEVETYDTIEQKFLHQQVKKQNNIDKIVDVAFDQIKQQPEVSSEKVDPDWTTRFFNIAEDISNEDMQTLWGRILSGEVQRPGSFSLRTLELLKNLTKEEAEIFTKFSQLKVKSLTDEFIPYSDKIYLQKHFNISYREILLMSELGLIVNNINHGLIFNGVGKETQTLFEYGEMGIYVVTEANHSKNSVLILSFTKIGSEISELISFENNITYIDYVCKSFSTQYTKIQIGKLAFKGNDRIITNVFKYRPKK